MRNFTFPFSFSPVRFLVGLVAVLGISYLGLIATVMVYAATTIQLTQSERDDEAAVASLESRYLAEVSSVTSADYLALGYAKPKTEIFVPTVPATALR